jgi:hypothetical protein
VEEVLSQVSLPEPKKLEDILEAIDWAYRKGRELAEVLS